MRQRPLNCPGLRLAPTLAAWLIAGFCWMQLPLVFSSQNALAAATGTAGNPVRTQSRKKAVRRNVELSRDWNQWNKLTRAYYRAVPHWTVVITDAKLRRHFAPKAVPILKQLVATEDNISHLEPSYAPYLLYFKLRNIAQLAAYGDKAAVVRLQTAAGAGNPRIAMVGQVEIAQYKWWIADGDAARQIKLLRSLEPLARKYPTSNALTLGIVRLGAFADTVNPKVSQYAVALVKRLQTPIARNTLEGVQSRLRLIELVGKPLKLKTPTLAGDTFNLKNWRGKVVLITFWQQPFSQFQLGGIYKELHPQGLEILAVPIDQRFTQIGTLMMTHPEMSWTQTAIQKPTGPGRTVFGLPIGPGNSMQIVLDRKGIVRMVSADPRINGIVPEIRKLLAQK